LYPARPARAAPADRDVLVEQGTRFFKNALARAPDDPDLQLRVGAAYVAIGRAVQSRCVECRSEADGHDAGDGDAGIGLSAHQFRQFIGGTQDLEAALKKVL
jgi:hypothetical protein